MYYLMLLFIYSCSLLAIPQEIYLPTHNFESSYPYITGNTVRACCDHILDVTISFDPNSVKTGDTIFVMTDFLEYFFTQVSPHIKMPYILVTHNFYDSSDNPVPGQFACYINDPHLIAWFTQNIDFVHPKLHPLPIGLANTNYEHGNKQMFDHYIAHRAHNSKKTGLLYSNFSINTNEQERRPVYEYFKNKSFCTTVTTFKKPQEYLEDLVRYKFVLSPRGNGLDCHRTWEALLMRCYPIVKSSTLNPLYENLPVVIVNDWSEVTPEFLDKKYQELSKKEYTWEKLYMPYWLEHINRVRREFLQARACS